jgi:hypothetical protein
MDTTKAIGVITRGSLEKGVEMKLHPDESIEEIKAGTFLVVRGRTTTLFDDHRCHAGTPATMTSCCIQPERRRSCCSKVVLGGRPVYTTVKLKPMLMRRLPASGLHIADLNAATSSHNDDWASQNVKNLNGVLATAGERNGGTQWGTRTSGRDEALPGRRCRRISRAFYRASEEDVARIFGRESASNSDWFNVGNPIRYELLPSASTCPNSWSAATAFSEKAGTGKTFLTRTVLCGLIHHRPEVVNLIFDSHNEYGWEARSEGGAPVKGLCQIFGKNKVKIYSLDADSSRARNVGHVEEVKDFARPDSARRPVVDAARIEPGRRRRRIRLSGAQPLRQRLADEAAQCGQR